MAAHGSQAFQLAVGDGIADLAADTFRGASVIKYSSFDIIVPS